jgi:hypothetical protein
VHGDQKLVAWQNKDEHVGLVHKLTTDEMFRLEQSATSMTFKATDVKVDSARNIVSFAGGATISIDETGLIELDSPLGVTLTCGASTLSVTAAGVALAAPSIVANAGAGAAMGLGAGGMSMNGKKVTIEADGVCKIDGKKKIKLQESEGKRQSKSANSASAATTNDRSEPGLRKESFDLWIRLDVDPKSVGAEDNRFFLTSGDGTIKITKTIADDAVPNDASVDLLFDRLPRDKSYSLYVTDGTNGHYAFQDMDGSAFRIIRARDASDASGTGIDMGRDVRNDSTRG